MKYFITAAFFLTMLGGCKKETADNLQQTPTVMSGEADIVIPAPEKRWTSLPTGFPNVYPYSNWNIGNYIMPVGEDVYMLSGSVYEYIYKYNKATQKFQVHTPTQSGFGFTIFYPGHKYLFDYGGKMYAGLNGYQTDTSYFFTIDPVTSAIVEKARFPGVHTPDPISFKIGTKGYVISAFNSSTPSKLWEYDFVANTWTNKGNSPLGNRLGAIAFVLDNKVYMGLGYDQVNFNGQLINLYRKDWIQFTPGSQWNAVKADFPGGGRRFASGYVLNGQAYLGLGSNNINQVRYKDFWKYNPATDTWKQEKDWPGVYADDDSWYGTPRNNVTLFTDGNLGFAVKGAANQVWRYSTSSLVIQ